jgi:Dyp-type peroxidase family
MAINLNQKSINPQAAQITQMMENLQGNILKGHGRDHALPIFFALGNNVQKNKQAICALTAFVTSSAEQLHQRDQADRNAVFGNLFLTARGYEKLGFTRQELVDNFPETGSTKLPIKFTEGMSAAQAELSDPDPALWESAYQDNKIDGMVLLACDDEERLSRVASLGRSHLLQAAADILGEEEGRRLRDEKGRTIENFGYVDGRSQPLYLKSDLMKENIDHDGTDVWNPAALLALVLIQDPFAPDPDSFGSFFVFRKLEQNVKKFKKDEEKIALALGLTGEDKERAGAMIIGRFEDGSPLALHKSPAGHEEAENNFTYANDPNGLRCPFHAHIRKVSPRGDTARQGGSESLDQEKTHRITRRGITYGTRATKKVIKDGEEFDALDGEAEFPAEGVGLLFMCFQANIADQFGFIQKQWANNGNFARNGTGIDPVIGQPVASTSYDWPAGYGEPRLGKPQSQREPFEGAVTMKGGEFFFAPSISFLKSLC